MGINALCLGAANHVEEKQAQASFELMAAQLESAPRWMHNNNNWLYASLLMLPIFHQILQDFWLLHLMTGVALQGVRKPRGCGPSRFEILVGGRKAKAGRLHCC